MSTALINKIKEFEESHKLIADHLIDAVWIVNASTLKYEYVSPSIEKLSGYSPKEFKKLTIMDRLTQSSLKEVMAKLERERFKVTPETNKIHVMEVELLNKDGYKYWVEIKAKFYLENNVPTNIVGTIRDITRKKKNERLNSKLISRLKKTIEEKDKLLEENTQLRSLLPICSGCKRIRDEQNKWWPLDMYVSKKTGSSITHTICPDCSDVFYGEMDND